MIFYHILLEQSRYEYGQIRAGYEGKDIGHYRIEDGLVFLERYPVNDRFDYKYDQLGYEDRKDDRQQSAIVVGHVHEEIQESLSEDIDDDDQFQMLLILEQQGDQDFDDDGQYHPADQG